LPVKADLAASRFEAQGQGIKIEAKDEISSPWRWALAKRPAYGSTTSAGARRHRTTRSAALLAAIAAAGGRGPAIVIGTDCPALLPEHLRAAAAALAEASISPSSRSKTAAMD